MTDLDERPGPPAAPPAPGAVDAGTETPGVGSLAGRGALLVSGIGLGLVGAHAIGVPIPGCPLRTATGFPCPFCGLTRVARHVVTGEVGAVASVDPAALVLAGMLAVAVIVQVVAMTRRRPGPVIMTTLVAGVAVLAVLGVHWVTTIVTGGALSL